MPKNSAQSLVLVIFVITAFAAITVTLAALTTKEVEIREIEETAFKARYTSDAGYERALYYLKTISREWPTFPYRRRIILRSQIENNKNLVDYPVPVVIDTVDLISRGLLQGDCSDIRFTDSDGMTLINYYFEGPCDSPNTRIWVEVPNIPQSPTEKIIYVYYGAGAGVDSGHNESVCPGGIRSGLCTEFFDDFSTSPSGGVWNIAESTNQYCTTFYEITAGGELHISSSSSDPAQIGPGACGYSFRTRKSINAQDFRVVIEGRFLFKNDDTYRGYGEVLTPYLHDQNGDKWGLDYSLTGDWETEFYQWINQQRTSVSSTNYKKANNIFTYIKWGDEITLNTTAQLPEGGVTYNPPPFNASTLELPFKFSLDSLAGSVYWGSGEAISFDAYWNSISIIKYAPNPINDNPDEEIYISPIEEEVPQGALPGQVIIGPNPGECPDALQCQSGCDCDQEQLLQSQYEYSVRITPYGQVRYDPDGPGGINPGDACDCGTPQEYCCCQPKPGNYCIDSTGTTL